MAETKGKMKKTEAEPPSSSSSTTEPIDVGATSQPIQQKDSVTSATKPSIYQGAGQVAEILEKYSKIDAQRIIEIISTQYVKKPFSMSVEQQVVKHALNTSVSSKPSADAGGKTKKKSSTSNTTVKWSKEPDWIALQKAISDLRVQRAETESDDDRERMTSQIQVLVGQGKTLKTTLRAKHGETPIASN